MFSSVGLKAWEEIPPTAAASVARAPRQILFILHLQLAALIYNFNNYCFKLVVFLVFHICLRGDFHLFSFVFVDFKITMEPSLASGRLSPFPSPVQVLSSVGRPRGGSGESPPEVLQPRGRGGFSLVLGFHLP